MSTPTQPQQPPRIEEIELAVKENSAVPAQPEPRDAAYWAPNVDRLVVDPDRAAAGFNVAGRRVTGPQQGVDVYDRNLQLVRHLTNSSEHADMGYDSAGQEVYVTIREYEAG